MKASGVISRVVGMLAAIVAAGACESTGAGPSPAPSPTPSPQNQSPAISQMAVVQSAFRTGRIAAAAADPDGQIASGSVEWGDATTTPLTSGFGSIALTHRYGRAQSYTVTLTVTDDKGVAAQSSRTVAITQPAESCVTVLVVEVCARPTVDFNNLQVSARALGAVVASLTVSDTAATMPLALGFGQLTLDYNSVTGRLSITGQVCPVPFLACETVGSTAIQF